ncbi:MAG: High-affinity nickel transporter [Ignavibacteriales bacterium]|nr:MAG: High-affinity nickel transporter [Ignavibacteriales bacterium]
MIAIISGLTAGFIHVVAGPDHLAAIAPIATVKRNSTWNIGFRWGLGHTAGVFIIGIITILFKEIIPIKLISGYSENLVGLVLIGIGLWGFHKTLNSKIHVHEHLHNGEVHRHFHKHTPGEEHDNSSDHVHTHAAMAVGILHGLAGSSHILGIIPALAFSTKTESFEYLAAFGIGTIAAMTIFSQLIGASSNFFVKKELKFYKIMMSSVSSVAIAVGIIWIVI